VYGDGSPWSVYEDHNGFTGWVPERQRRRDKRRCSRAGVGEARYSEVHVFVLGSLLISAQAKMQELGIPTAGQHVRVGIQGDATIMVTTPRLYDYLSNNT
jgi:hypothetical protein